MSRDGELTLFDSHCHLADRAYASDLELTLSRARQAGVVGMLCVGYDLRSSRAAVSLAERHDDIWAAVGVHPHYADEVASALPRLETGLRTLVRHPKVVALGETGLDFYRDLSPRPAQRNVFRRQVEVSLELGLPLLVHDREAHEETLQILREYYGGRRVSAGAGPGAVPGGPERFRVGIMHCFSGDAGLAAACLDLGFHLSFAGPLTYPKSDQARRTAASVPRERLLIETDCPYLAPQSHRGRRNEPALVADVALALAEARGVSPSEIAATTTANARELLGLG